MELTDARHVVVGGGVLGLSAAWRLAERGADVLVLDKGRIGGGASGAAGGIVRNYYRAPAITDVVRLSVEMFEADPEAFGFRQVGYLAAVPEAQVDDLVAINGRHRECGYESELVVGEGPCSEYLGWTWPDWEAPVAALLHERRGGWADPMRTVRRLAELARAAGAEIAEGVEVTGIESGEAGVEVVETSRGRISCERLLLAPGPWAAGVLGMLGGAWPPISYWKAQEGEFELRAAAAGARAGQEPPVVHLDQAGPLRSDADGRVLVDGPWGIYFRVGAGGATVTGGGLPMPLVEPDLDPYGPDNPEHAAERPSPTSSPRASPRRSAAFAATPATGARRSPAGSSPTRPTTTRSATGWPRTPTRSSTPATASSCSRSAASPPTSSSTANHASSPSACLASSAAKRTRHQRGRIRGLSS